MKKILAKLGKKGETVDDQKTKVINLSSNITSHDLENKKRQAIAILKKAQVLKIYLKLTSFDSTTLSRGKILLNNFASDLSQYASISVRPGF